MTKLYWYFSDAGRRLRYGDGRKIVLGAKHSVPGGPVLCSYGLHASARALDALKYAPGPVVWRVRLGGEIAEEGDKACAQTREYVAGGVGVSDVLRKFARDCALDVAHLWGMPEIVRQYLKTGREDLRAEAHEAAAATYVANAATYAATYATYAATNAANAAATYATYAANAANAQAANAAATNAANAANAAAATRERQNRRLTRALLAAIRGEKA